MKQTVWISYDFGVRGDYPGLYKWLDTKKAKECGDSVAYFVFEYNSNIVAELKKDISANVTFKNGDRIYLIYTDMKDGKLHTVGNFIIGNRRAAPWEGYAPLDENIEDW
ncbi:MAG: hypothetical protein HY738_05415 [Bacteroidia bacterium]|nr:hypothetical protein [Bacteroidia bacterium]